MILLSGVIAGLLVSLARARFRGDRLAVPSLRLLWLVPAAFLPQWLAFDVTLTRNLISNDLARVCLVGSQVLLLVFALANWKQPAFWALGLGLGLNLLVIGLNGGLMPISPETVSHLIPNAAPGAWQVDHRLGSGKDIVLNESDTQFAILSDHFLLPDWIPYRVAFSVGDVLIAIGAFWFLASLGGHVSSQGSQSES